MSDKKLTKEELAEKKRQALKALSDELTKPFGTKKEREDFAKREDQK